MDNSNIAIRVEGLGKRYNLGQTVDLRRNFRETLMHLPRFLGSKVGGAGRSIAQRLERRSQLSHLEEAPEAFDSETPHGTIWALKDISFEAKEGEAIGIIGRNGAGKSTLLKILSRITSPTAGRAELYGRVGSLLEVGTGFNAELTGRENIYLNGSILGMTKAEINRRFDEIIEFAGVTKFLDTPVKRYSSGMRVRLGFAVAAHLEPEILIVDEVLSVGDAEFRNKCLGKMQDVTGGGRTVLFVSHSMAAVQALCARTILLNQGRLVTSGPTEKVIQQYIEGVISHSQKDLEHRIDREGSGLAKCVAIWFESAERQPLKNAVCGAPLEICLQYRSQVEGAPFRFAIGFYDIMGRAVAHLGSIYSGDAGSSVPSSGVMRCLIPRLPLVPGEYFLNVSIADGGGSRADRVERAATLSVAEGDFFGSGRIPPAATGYALIDNSWRLDVESHSTSDIRN